MNEIALSLGPDQNLVGVLTPSAGAPKSIAVLLLNAGVVHRIGPHRTSVKLARHLALQGYTAVRFDVSGVGDSRAPGGAVTYAEQAVRDIRTVIDYLQRQHGFRRCALYGICAGAENAYAAALADDRVAGVFMFDGYAYPTFKSRLIQFTTRLRTLSARRVPAILKRWTLRLLPARFRRLRGVLPPGPPRPTREQFARDVQALVDRGVRVAMTFSRTEFRERYCYPAQLRDGFAGHRFIEHVACHHAPEIDHLVTSRTAQRRLLALVDDWIATVR